MFAVLHKWTEADVKKYLGRLCINEATVILFVDSCRQFVLLKDIADNSEEYTAEEIEEIEMDASDNPSKYDKPKPPAMWFLSEPLQKPEGIMHMSMGIQKAILKFIIHWAAEKKMEQLFNVVWRSDSVHCKISKSHTVLVVLTKTTSLGALMRRVIV